MSLSNHSSDHLLRRYLNGAITAPEEAELERRALTDETLAEAMRGVQAFPEEDHALRVARMKQAARSQVQRKEVGLPPQRRFIPWAAAAAIALLLGSTFLLLPWLNGDGGNEELALQTESVAAPATAPSPSAAATPAAVAADETLAVTPPLPSPSRTEPAAAPPLPPVSAERARNSKAAAKQQPNNEARSRSNNREPAATAATSPQAELIAEAEDAEDIVVAKTEAAPPPPPVAPIGQAKLSSPAPASATSDDFSGAFAPGFVNGLVTNENGVPIGGALVRLPGQPVGERTDSLGLFRLPANGIARLIEVTHPDYETEEVELSVRNNDIQINLDRKAYQKKLPDIYSPAAGATIITWNTQPGYAKPVEGYATLRSRIENNAPENLPPGKYKFSFLVNTDGTLTDFEFRGRPDRAVMDYIGETMVRTSVWQIVDGEAPVRVYFNVRFGS